MPKNPVTDPINDQEIAFAHLLMSGTMNDRQAAEAVGLNPTTAAYIKSKPRVCDYMARHRAAVEEKLVDQEAERLRSLKVGRDQILDRLWYLASLSAEQTRGSIAGQIKAISMIVAIEGLVPNRINNCRVSAAPRVQPEIQLSEPMTQPQAESTDPGEDAAAEEAQSAAPQMPEPSLDRTPTGHDNPFIYPKATNSLPHALDLIYNANLSPAGSLTLLIPPEVGAVARAR